MQTFRASLFGCLTNADMISRSESFGCFYTLNTAVLERIGRMETRLAKERDDYSKIILEEEATREDVVPLLEKYAPRLLKYPAELSYNERVRHGDWADIIITGYPEPLFTLTH